VHEPVAYLITVARNLVVDSIRRHQSKALDVAYPQRTQLDEADLYERHVEAVAAYVAGLPPELSAAFDARFVRGMSQRDAAVAMGVTRRRVRTLEKRLVTGAARELSGSAPHDAGCPPCAANE
jgi:RNA polymerase sigma-70 factor (ECF subfamily)